MHERTRGNNVMNVCLVEEEEVKKEEIGGLLSPVYYALPRKKVREGGWVL